MPWFIILLISAAAFLLGAALSYCFKSKEIKLLKQHSDSENQHFREMLEQANAQWSLQVESLRKDLSHDTTRQTMAANAQLQQSNTEQMAHLMAPIKEQFAAFQKAIEESRAQELVNRKSIEDTFINTLKIFQLQQAQAVRTLQDETARIGNEAVALANALKNDNKKQGNWGEMVLQTMLENSGLEENVHFFMQYDVKDCNGKHYIPDVVIKFPEGRSLIIDSKVSLTAYTASFETDDEDKRADLLKAHLASVEKHVKELADKQYPRYVDNAMDLVLMFIPNESSYIAAMKLKPDLLHQAYQRKVLIISPNNLMMALHLAYSMWQNDKQVKNVAKIVERGSLLYDKVRVFQESFDEINNLLRKLQLAYDKAQGQLSTGPGSVLRQCDQLRSLGVKVDAKKALKIDDDGDQREPYISS